MPFVLRHTETLQLFSCHLLNQYDLTYYGTKSWDILPPPAEYRQYLAEQGVEELDKWEVIEITPDQLKMCNVKLNNNPAHRLYFTGTQVVMKKVKSSSD